MGTKSTISYKKLSEEYLNSQSTHWMYCPYCYSIPSIKQFLKKGELYISIYCKCLYDKKETMTFKNNEVKEDYFKGMRCRWFTSEGQMQEAIFSTKDLVKYE